MAYHLIDVEVSAPESVEMGADEDGVAVLVRRHGRPVAFFLVSEERRALSSSDVLGLVERNAAVDVARDAILTELRSPLAPAPMDITVAVCTRDRPEWLRSCLAALTALDEPGCAMHVLVVDNAPSDGRTEAVASSFEGVRYVVEPVPGLDVARNRALAETTTELIAFVDDDVVVDRSWLAGLREAWTEEPRAAAVTGPVLPLELLTPAQLAFERRGGFRRGMAWRRFSSGNAYRRNHPLAAGVFGTGANMAFRVDVLRSLGGFDEALDTGPPLPGGGDLDMFQRVVAAGHVLVYEPRVLVFHRHRREMSVLRRQYWTWGTGHMAYLYKTARTDPAARRRVVRFLAAWLTERARHAVRDLRSSSDIPPSVAVAQLAGAVLVGWWKYPASRARMARLARSG